MHGGVAACLVGSLLGDSTLKEALWLFASLRRCIVALPRPVSALSLIFTDQATNMEEMLSQVGVVSARVAARCRIVPQQASRSIAMNPEQIMLVQASVEVVLPTADTAAALFYRNLFELDPSLRPLFRSDMQEQGRKLMTMLRFVVKGLNRLDTLVPQVQALGRRHAGYRVLDAHHDTVGAALLATLRQGLGDAFTPEVAAAWAAAYTLLAETMKAATILEEIPV